MNIRIRGFTFVVGSFVLGAVSSIYAGPKVSVGVAVPPNQQVSMDRIDHSTWDALLRKYVDLNGRVNYRAWHSSPADSNVLTQYLSTLSTASPSIRASKPATLAYWINAYNAVTIKGILREYPTTSIRNHTARLYGYNIWKDLLLNVGEKQVSLNQIEHEILRKTGEPRIHFAIVCASHSCPRLMNEAYVAEKLEQQLTINTKNFFANSENFRYDARSKRFQMSAILDWFASDFGSDQAAQLKTIAPYLPDKASYQAALSNGVKVAYLDYDWSLNEQRAPSTARR